MSRSVSAFEGIVSDIVARPIPLDGTRSNALIPLASGTYVELITFNVDPPPRGHEWAPSPNGPMDFALFGTTTKDQRHAVEIVAEAGGDGQLAYREAVVGGRVRPDGKKLECEVPSLNPTDAPSPY